MDGFMFVLSWAPFAAAAIAPVARVPAAAAALARNASISALWHMASQRCASLAMRGCNSSGLGGCPEQRLNFIAALHPSAFFSSAT